MPEWVLYIGAAFIGFNLFRMFGGFGNPGSLPDYDPDLAKKLVSEQNAVLLDVRSPGEFSGGHPRQAKNIPVTALGGRLKELDGWTKGNKQHPVVVYCASGMRSGKAKRILLKAGFENVTNLGSVSNWPG